ncbi:MAG TPA: hypothetical protein VMW16_16165 [Sedimentisphaerales bacterium]|nr:hypothetical protein [Sedimentisphaerales bacterium]
MKSKKVSLLNTIVFIIIGSMVVCGAETANANKKCANTKVDYLNLVRSYADAMIEHGRDVYGPDKTPLFAVALDRKNMKLVEKLEKTQGIRSVDRHLKCANPMVDQNLYQVLYALTEVTGEKRYAQEADKTLKWFFEHCQSPATGLMAWGDHIGWDIEREAPGPLYKVKKGKNKGTVGLAPHELSRPWVLWERSNILAPKACATFARGLWDNQIHEHSGDFSRHAGWAKPATSGGSNYPRHSGFYIAAWADAYSRSKDPIFLEAIEVVVDFIESRRNLITGALPCQSGEDSPGEKKRTKKALQGEIPNNSVPMLPRTKIVWPQSELSLAVDLWDAAKMVPEPLARKMRFCASKTDHVFLRIKHDLSPNGPGFMCGVNADTLEPLTGGKWTHTLTWDKNTDAQAAMLCYLRYCQVGLEGYKKLILDSAARYLVSEPDAEAMIFPGKVGNAIFLMVVAHELSGDAKYLKRADYFADKATEMFFDADSPLPKATSIHQHYEAVTRCDTLMMSLLRLWEAHNQPDKKLSLVYNDR